MTDANVSTLMRASEKASLQQVQHVVIAVNSNGDVQVNGSSNVISGLVSNEELYNELTNNILQSKIAADEQVNLIPVILLNYPLLPCSPYSEKWKGSAMIRGVLNKMVERAEFGRRGRRSSLGMCC